MKNDKSQNNSVLAKTVKSVIFGTIIGSIICVLMLLTVSFVFVKMQTIPEVAITPSAIFIACTASFAGGYFSARIRKSMGMVLGVASALLMFVTFLLIGLILSTESIGIVSLLRMILMVISGAIGGILGVNKRKRRK